jgi:phenylalanyl-tRNA synthetase beta chain
MTISYHWLCEYLPDNLLIKPSPEQLSRILTSIGLEVEQLSVFESVKGLLEGLVAGEVVRCEPHPNADKLKITMVDAGRPELLQIVCGALNVARGQKVIVAPVGTVLYPETGEPVTIKAAKIRGVESQGMLCAEDEIGLGKSHAGIYVLPASIETGTPAAAYFKPYTDHIFEIGLTPNHMDAMSHIGVARDVCAYLSHHEKKDFRVKMPSLQSFAVDNRRVPIAVKIENKKDCQRYSGLSIRGIRIGDSPAWMQQKLRTVGIRPINNIVDITNYVLHETGQPLHAFDADAITGNQIIVKNLPAGTKFQTLDEKERILDASDLMICNAEEGMCLAGVFGGLKSGISEHTVNMFLESAWFNPSAIRKTSVRHGLRTEAASHFEKGMDISGTVSALKRAALLIKEYAGGEIASDIVDVYPLPEPRIQIPLRHHYLKKLSGKNYHSESVKNILISLGFDILREGMDDLLISVPYHKPDILLPADVVEEIMRIDGYDQIPIPGSITISPSVDTEKETSGYAEKIGGYLTGQGFYEIFTNSITNSAYYSAGELEHAVKMINNLSAELNIMRPSLLESGLESIAWNLNRKNNDLRFFEFGKSYRTGSGGNYVETNHLCLYLSGNARPGSWKGKETPFDFYYLKGIAAGILELAGISGGRYAASENNRLDGGLSYSNQDLPLLELGAVGESSLQHFDIRQPVFFADIYWDNLLKQSASGSILFTELPKQLPVYRDLALVIKKAVPYAALEEAVRRIGLNKLQKVELFDIFESEKLGEGKKSMAVSFTFMDPEKTLTDKEIDGMMNRIMKTVEEELQAEIRK